MILFPDPLGVKQLYSSDFRMHGLQDGPCSKVPVRPLLRFRESGLQLNPSPLQPVEWDNRREFSVVT
jgi:hypothetical protein